MALTAGAIFLTIIVVAILIIIALIVIFNRNPDNPTFVNPQRWSIPSPSSDNAKNTCQVYTFPTVTVDTAAVAVDPGTVVPGVPTFNSTILNNLTGNSNLPTCLDNDQIIARQVTHTCQGSDNINLCYTLEGQLVPTGTTETYYSISSVQTANGQQLEQCPATNACFGELSLISIDFNNSLKSCIEINRSPTVAVVMDTCDPTNENQLFRVTRTMMGQPASQNTQTGPFAQILDRQSGLCLNPTTTGSTISDPVTSFAGPSSVGSDVTLTACSALGTDWLLLPPLTLCPNTDTAPKCSIKNTLPQQCGSAAPSAQQIVYTGNLDLTKMPTNPNCLLAWLKSVHAKSLYRDNNQLVLRDINISKEDPYVAQYINLNLYNFIIQQNACVDLNQLNCMGF